MIRSLEPELMDSPEIAGPILEKFHLDLERIHGFLGTFPTIERFLKNNPRPIRRVLDIGCGGGALLDYLRRRMNIEVIGIDLKPAPTCDIPVIAANAIHDPLPEADVAVSSLMAHHLSPEENLALIRNVARSCPRYLIHDLIRHPMPLVLFTLFICPLIGKEAAVDGRQSIRRAYTPDEFKKLLEGIEAKVEIDVSPFLSRQIVDIQFAGHIER